MMTKNLKLERIFGIFRKNNYSSATYISGVVDAIYNCVTTESLSHN